MPRKSKSKINVVVNVPKQKQGKRKKKSHKAKGMGAMSLAVISTAKQTCSVTNPFCDEANAAKWPDNSYSKSNVLNAYQLDSIASDASGNGSKLLVGDIYYNSNPTSTASMTAVTYTTLNAVATSGLARYRLTSWGVKLSAPYISPMTAAGVVSVRIFSPLGGTSLGTVDTQTSYADAFIDVPLASLIEKPLFIIPKPLGDNARLFRDINSTTATLASWVNPGWQCINVAVTGTTVSLTRAIKCETWLHFEVIPVDSDTSYSYATQPPPENPVVQHASSSVLSDIGNFIEGGFEKVDKVVHSKTMKYLSSAAAYFAGGPAGAAGTFLMLDNGKSGKAHRMIQDVD